MSLDGGLQHTCVTDAETESTCFEKPEVVDLLCLPLLAVQLDSRMEGPLEEILEIPKEECLEKIQK